MANRMSRRRSHWTRSSATTTRPTTSSTRSGSSPPGRSTWGLRPPEGALHLALELALLDRLALVADVLAARERDLDLGAVARGEVEPGRAQRQPLLLGLADQALDLPPVHEQLARTLGLVVLARGRPVRRDVHVV